MICFSSNGDLLSQWRAYSDNGKGVSIGFSRKYLNEIIKTESKKNYDFAEPEFRFFDLVYDKSKHIKYIDDLLNSIDLKKEVDLLMDNYDHSSVTFNRVLKLVIPIYKSCIISKNPNFIEEKETRLVSGTPEVISDQDCLCYRFTDTDMISYVKFPLDLKGKSKSVFEIIIGPKSNIEVKDLENYLTINYKYGSRIRVLKSACSYR